MIRKLKARVALATQRVIYAAFSVVTFLARVLVASTASPSLPQPVYAPNAFLSPR
jgi:hypothetical protein